MKITEITYSFSTKVNIGNYESCDVFCAGKAVVDDDETPDDVFNALRDWVRAKVRSERATIKEKLKTNGQ